ncbi:complex I subunit 5 family protein [Saccharothrix texasensis]|uniref:Multisubunit sodium/proton antiporter MrpD subunit n=1 Tax=Saccharothrix texasensis TaxID=103734 RepID=A0A3N1HHT3_9PSEU|nr:proton-conducting transporter membrane subunit [Saccharothrix texasensis]ROP42045.1 multisubunit sodium/proton antiporter MrpD subunit [Saccharothrix texasensis]
MLLSTALLLPWVSGAVLVALDGRRRVVAWLAVASLAATLAVLGVLAADVLGGDARQVVTGGWPAGVGVVLRADALGVAFALLSLLVLLAGAAHEAVGGVRSRTFPGLVVLLGAGLTGLFVTADVFSFYVFFELAMTASYALSAYGGKRRQLRAAVVFTAVNLLGSFVFLLSVAGAYHVTGALAMGQVAERVLAVNPNAAILIAAGFFIAFSVKLGLFPFHFWLPTVYAGARPAVAAILSGAVANIGAYGLLRFGVDLFPEQLRLAGVALVVLGAASIVYGGVLAVARGDAAEMLAYSAIGQVGYVLVALGVGGPVGLVAAVLYSVVNSLNKALLFLTSGVRGPLVAAAFAVGALSVAGVPPAAGFIGKLELFRTAIVAGSAALVVLLVVGSALSLVYLFQVYQRSFWRPDPSATGVASPLPQRLLTAVSALLVLAAGLWPEPLLLLSKDAVDALLAVDPQ